MIPDYYNLINRLCENCLKIIYFPNIVYCFYIRNILSIVVSMSDLSSEQFKNE